MLGEGGAGVLEEGRDGSVWRGSERRRRREM